MLSYFQVNRGTFLQLEQELPPTARVAELCTGIERVSGERADSQVLLTSDGKQMDPRELIGKYSVGTDDKPIYVFYRSYLSMEDVPAVKLRTPARSRSLQKQQELLRQKPTPSLFHLQISLAKQFTEFSQEVGRLCDQLSVEYSLQFNGWQTALSNCSDIIVLFKKHQQMFGKTVERFRSEKPNYLELLKRFPEQVKLLQELPLPSSLQKSTSSSLYDWISTHDEKNSLMDLRKECQKSLDKIDGDQLDNTLQMSEEVSDMCSDVVEPSDKTFKSEVTKIKSLSDEAKEILTTVSALNQNIQVTSDKALRAGDAKTIAILVDSHHKSLQLISGHCSRLEAISSSLEASKADLTTHVHRRLKQLMEMQRRVKESNDQLRIFHEQVKLARQRFEILQQVSSTPEVLVEVFGELGRRRSYNMALEKVMSETSSRLQKAREEEKNLRKKFSSNHGGHFVTSLFPELQDRVPDVSFHAPKSLSKSHDVSLESLCAELPKNMRPSIQMDSSIHTLLQALTSDTSGLTTQTSNLGLPTTSPTHLSSPANSHSSTLASSPSLRSCSETPISSSTETAEHAQTGIEELKELVGKLELNNVSLTSKLRKQLETKSTLEASVMETKSVCADLVEKLEKSEATVASLRDQLAEMAARTEAEAASAEEFKRVKLELTEKLALQEEEKVTMEEALKRVKEDSHGLLTEKNQFLGELNEMRSRLAQKEDKEKTLVINVEKAVGDCEKLKHLIDEMQIKMNGLETRLARAAEEKMELIQEKEEISKEGHELKSQQDQHLKVLEETKINLEAVEAKYVQDVEKLKKDCSELEGELVKLRENQHIQKSKELEKIVHEKQQLTSLTESLTTDKNALNSELVKLRQQWSAELAKLKNELALSMEESSTLREALAKQEHELATVSTELKENKNASSIEKQKMMKELEVSQNEVGKIREELAREQQRHSQAQSSLKSSNTKLETLTTKGKDLAIKLEEEHSKNQELSLLVQRTSQSLSDKNSEILALKSDFEAEKREMDVKNTAEMKKAAGAAAKAKTLENLLNQKEGELSGYKDKLLVAEKRIEELEVEVERKKKHILSILGKSDQGDGVARLRFEVEEKNEKIRRLQEELDSSVQNLRAEINGARREVADNRQVWNEEKDVLLMRNMELERDLKELRRNQEGSGSSGVGGTASGRRSSASAGDSPKQMSIERGASSSSLSSSTVPASGFCSGVDLAGGVAIHSLQKGQIALFMSDIHGNYLALSVDGKTYYLNSICTSRLTDIAPRMTRIQLDRKVLIGRITDRAYMEVRKENNRLKVPVGSRLYRVEAEGITM